ncbi:MAG: hypothetical protein BGP13_07535 [Sphingobacteriales bacterium 40-81]|nr:MAG: hypothetical protein BGP13_07535 [Sphingobacteriales bacterium 40-81]
MKLLLKPQDFFQLLYNLIFNPEEVKRIILFFVLLIYTQVHPAMVLAPAIFRRRRLSCVAHATPKLIK